MYFIVSRNEILKIVLILTLSVGLSSVSITSLRGQWYRTFQSFQTNISIHVTFISLFD